MKGWLAALRTELRQGSTRWILLMVTLTIVALLWVDHSGDWGGRWNSLGRFMREMVIVLGPLCVTLGAWQGGRGRRAGVGELMTSTRRTVLERTSVEIAAIWLVISTGVLLGWASAAWTIVLVGGWGSSAAAWYLLGLLPAVLAYTTAGYAIGSLAPWRIVAPIAGVATYVGLGILLWNSDKDAVPMGGGWLGGTDGFPFDLDALMLSFGVLLAAAVTLWGLISAERRPGASRQWLPLVVAGTLGTALLAPLAVAAADTDGLVPRAAEDTPLTCTSDEPQVCVLAEDRLLLDVMTHRARPVLERLAHIPDAPTQAGPLLDAQDTSVLGVEPGATTPWGKVDPNWGSDVQVHVIFDAGTYCPTGSYQRAPIAVERAFQGSTELVVGWLLNPDQRDFLNHFQLESRPGDGNDGLRELHSRFVASTEQQRVAFATRVLAASRDCDIAAVSAAADALAVTP